MLLETKATRRFRSGNTEYLWDPLLLKLRKHQVYVLVALGICLIGVAGFVLARATPQTDGSLRRDLVAVSHQAVRAYVREDLRVTLPGEEETSITELPDGKYQVSGWVDLIPEAGGKAIRQAYICTLYPTDSGDWAVESISVVPQ